MTETTCEKSLRLADLYREYEREIVQNPVTENAGGYKFVFGDGGADSRVVLIGEAPGKDEVAEGRPFVGKAGAILNSFMSGAGIDRGELFITNAVKYRLARESKGGRGIANRPAKIKEIKQSSVFLLKELQIIKPKFIVTLGNVPLKSVVMCIEAENIDGRYDSVISELSGGVGECHGRAYRELISDAVLVPLYHPASTIYNRSLEAVYEEDLAFLNGIILEDDGR